MRSWNLQNWKSQYGAWLLKSAVICTTGNDHSISTRWLIPFKLCGALGPLVSLPIVHSMYLDLTLKPRIHDSYSVWIWDSTVSTQSWHADLWRFYGAAFGQYIFYLRSFPQDSKRLKLFVSERLLHIHESLDLITYLIARYSWSCMCFCHPTMLKCTLITDDDVSQLSRNNTRICLDRDVLVYPYFVPS